MNKIINEEYDLFKKYHKNIYNIMFHILCGFIFMAFFFTAFAKYSYLALSLYFAGILATTGMGYVSGVIYVVLAILVYIIGHFRISTEKLLLGSIVFYMLPDASHYLTGEPSLLNWNNLTVTNVITNVFYLLPFSIMCVT